MNARRSEPALTCLDIFAGAGGFSLGAEAAGFLSVGAIEIDAIAARTLQANFGFRPLDFLGPERGDIETALASNLPETLSDAGVSDLDLLIACPPCQGFSRVGRGKLDSLAEACGAFALDSRNSLYRHAIQVLRRLRPRAFIFENVAGILHLRGSNAAEEICQAVAEAGYRTRCALLNAAWYGVPQTRERVVVLALREDLGIEPRFPARGHEVELTRGHLSAAELSPATWANASFFVTCQDLPSARHLARPVTVRDALTDLPAFTAHLDALRRGRRYRARREEFPPVAYGSGAMNEYARLMRNWSPHLTSDRVTDHFCRWTPRDFETFRRLAPNDRYPQAHAVAVRRYHAALARFRAHGGRRPRRAAFVPPYSLDGFDEKWRKLVPDQPSWTVTAHLAKDTYSHIHFDSRQARGITPREAARLQSFPDAFRFCGNTGDMFRQIGNAVPPVLARALCVEIAACLQDQDAAEQPRATRCVGVA
jgi:DNA (cytosine-5)-methyltransferase 1